LGRHVAMKHKSIGLPAFREAMSIPTTAPLMTEDFRERKREMMQKRGTNLVPGARRQRPASVARRSATIRKTARSMGARNLHDRCIAQLAHKLTDLAHTLGRSPSAPEARQILGHTLVYHIIQTFGTWNNAKAQCGLLTAKRGSITRTKENRALVLDALEAWLKEHDDLPTYHDAMFGNTTPALPPPSVFYAVFGRSDWDACMRIGASLLDFHGGKYGLPEKTA
jgi:hypothetical protein